MPDYKEQENRPVRRNTSDEIDLVVVFNAIGSFFRGIKNGISFLIQAALMNIVVVALIVAGFLGVAYLGYVTTKPYYTSSMTLVLANIRNEFIEDQLNKLSEMIDDDNFEAVAERLDITPADAKEIREMKFFNLDQDRIDEDSVLTGSPFRIELTIYSPNLFETLEPAITNYLENNRYFARQKRIKQRQVENMITKLKGEISSIDSLKTNVSEPRGPVNGFVYGQPIDPTNLYRESISMFKEQVNLESDLEKLANVEIVTGFIPRLRPTGPSLRKYLAISGLVGLILGLIVAINLENKKRRRAGIA
ncbi:chain length determinant protein [Pontibacter lucknowensis]|uniref:Chain length determinant protein n=1 Tax=Pontibacter lucknowensis TaxID=1077936 RepID=A0A1N7ASW3_9BACT|nr:chain length determinant protein [Pontibacter lucknowensis]SIR42103.1 hypothetical protein SAMN05421545_3547 [Pontibacter lucknowensis]